MSEREFTRSLRAVPARFDYFTELALHQGRSLLAGQLSMFVCEALTIGLEHFDGRATLAQVAAAVEEVQEIPSFHPIADHQAAQTLTVLHLCAQLYTPGFFATSGARSRQRALIRKYLVDSRVK